MGLRGQRGINPKAWFYGLREILVNEQNRPCVLGGAACEQWLNGELFRVIAEGLKKTKLTAYPEWKRRQHDVAVLPYRPNDPDAWYSPAAIIECKVLYSNYSPGKRALPRWFFPSNCLSVNYLHIVYLYR